MSIDQEREEEILQRAEDRATEDAGSLYPLAEESESALLVEGQHIAREFGLVDEESALFAGTYASLYRAEIECLDQDYEPQNGEESGFIRARRIRLAALDPLACFRLYTPVSKNDYVTYRQARRAYNASWRMHKSVRLSAAHFMDVDRKNLREEFTLLACGPLKHLRAAKMLGVPSF